MTQNSYEYDSLGNLQYVATPWADRRATSTTQPSTVTTGSAAKRRCSNPPRTAGRAHAPITLTTYDADGNVASVVDARGASDDTLDAFGNMTSDGSISDAAHTTQYTYDQMDRKTIVTLPDPRRRDSSLHLVLLRRRQQSPVRRQRQRGQREPAGHVLGPSQLHDRVRSSMP